MGFKVRRVYDVSGKEFWNMKMDETLNFIRGKKIICGITKAALTDFFVHDDILGGF